jgi:cell wall-associated NlpC family hydrolase
VNPPVRTRTTLVALALAAPLALAGPAVAAPGLPVGLPGQAEAPQQSGQHAQEQQGGQQQPEQQEDTRTLGEKAVDEARTHDGKPYEYGATGPDSFDCSGFVQYVFAQVGRELPRTSRDQYAASEKVAREDVRLGDLIAIHNSKGTVTHVGIYAGDHRMWVASSGAERVKLQEIYTDRYRVGRFS